MRSDHQHDQDHGRFDLACCHALARMCCFRLLMLRRVYSSPSFGLCLLPYAILTGLISKLPVAPAPLVPFCMAQHSLSALHSIWLVRRWVGHAPTLQRGVGRGVRATSTAQLGCPSAPATLWTLQKAERASLQVSSTFCCHASGRSDLECLTVCLQQAC